MAAILSRGRWFKSSPASPKGRIHPNGPFRTCWRVWCWKYNSNSRQVNMSFKLTNSNTHSLSYSHVRKWKRGLWHSLIASFMGPRWAPCWPHKPCYLGYFNETKWNENVIILTKLSSLGFQTQIADLISNLFLQSKSQEKFSLYSISDI